MSGFLVDTNGISEFVRPQPNERVTRWLDAADPESLFVSVITFGEIRLGLEDLPARRRRAALEEWFENGLPAWFDAHLLPVTKAIADRWGRLAVEAKKNGISLATADGLIAGTAIEHNLAIVTRNVADFSTCGAVMINPWEL